MTTSRFYVSFCSILILSLLAVSGAGCGQYVPEDYVKTTRTGGAIEAKYLALGPSEVDYLEFPAPKPDEKHSVYFPKELREDSGTRYPVVVLINGTGVLASKYVALFHHLASWGFVVVGNEDPSTGTGRSADRALAFILGENKREGSPFFGKIDEEKIGASGHSQGGAGVFNAITSQGHSDLYKAAVALSPTNEKTARGLFQYDASLVRTPILIIAGDTGGFETKMVIPLDEMTRMYERIDATKGMLRKKGCEHGHTLYAADGYATAWLRAFLCDDEEAKSAFFGENPEALRNELYSDGRFELE